MSGFIGGSPKRVALFDSYTKNQVFTKDESLSLFVKSPDASIGSIGEPGSAGFGVGVYPLEDVSTLNLTPKFGYDDPSSDDYGNYVHDNGSVMVFVPKFYYRTGNAAHPKFSLYGANAVEIRGSETYSSEAEANVDGFILHRAFIDGGVEKAGFFIDKYIASKHPDNPNIAVSMRLGVPISLTTDANYTRSQGMTGCVGQLHDAITLSKARGTQYQNATVFMNGALALLSLAHGQYAENSVNCAWYDSAGITNYPKGCNDNSLGDANDISLSFESAGDTGNSAKPKTGSASNLAKTSHNGQVCGVIDLNGAMWEVGIGITMPGASATAIGTVANNTLYILNESVEVATLTPDWNTSTSVWGDATNLANKYSTYTSNISLSGLGGWIQWGNGSAGVFFTQQSGNERAINTVTPPSNAELSSGGINLLGQDGLYRYTRENLYLQSGGSWYAGSGAGVWARTFGNFRSGSDAVFSFRAATFGQ